MTKICYETKKFSRKNLVLISKVNDVIELYKAENAKPTIKKIFINLIRNDALRDNIQEYKRLVSVVGNARIAGLIDWDAIEGRRQGHEKDITL